MSEFFWITDTDIRVVIVNAHTNTRTKHRRSDGIIKVKYQIKPWKFDIALRSNPIASETVGQFEYALNRRP